MATSVALHALLLLLFAVFVLPSIVDGGKRVLEVSLGDSDTFSLDATDLPVVMPPYIGRTEQRCGRNSRRIRPARIRNRVY